MRKLFFALLVCLLATSVQAQNVYNSSGRKVAKKPAKKTGFDVDKLVLGGDFRFSAGQGVSVGIAPMVGYKLADKLYGGIRLGYGYDRVKVDYRYLPASATTNVFSSNAFSGGVWGRYLLWQSIYAHVEGEYNIYESYYQDDLTGMITKARIKSPSVLVGVGFRQPLSDRTSFNTTILYDVLNQPNSYYQGGLDFRFGILVGF